MSEQTITEPRIVFTEEESVLLRSLHYFGCEFPGSTWDGIPHELVVKGLDGLSDFLLIMEWSRKGHYPYAEPNNDIVNDVPF